MTRLESITDIRQTLLYMRLMQDRSLNDRESFLKFQANHEQLLDRFYTENGDMMAPQQYDVAKQDIDFFMQIVDLAYWFWMEEDKKSRRTDKIVQ